MIRLSVNVNKVATVRNARGGRRPEVVAAARTAAAAGAQGITVHPRPDERHIRRQDVLDLAVALPPEIEFNVEGYPAPEWLALVAAVRPTQATLVPDAAGVLTSDRGWDLRRRGGWLGQEILPALRDAGCRISLFVEPEAAAVEAAAELGADCVELYTEPYARAWATPERAAVLETYVTAARRAVERGLAVHAGHDLDLENLPLLAARLPGLVEVSIGHALICDALECHGLEGAVREYRRVLDAAASGTS